MRRETSDLFADGPADEALDLEVRFDLGQAGLVVLDPRLVHQTDVREEAADLAHEDLVEHLRGLALELGIGGERDLLFLGDHFGGDVGAAGVGRVERRDVHADVVQERGIGLALDLDQHADAAAHVVITGEDAVAGALPLLGAAELDVLADGADVLVERGLFLLIDFGGDVAGLGDLDRAVGEQTDQLGEFIGVGGEVGLAEDFDDRGLVAGDLGPDLALIGRAAHMIKPRYFQLR